MVKLNYMAWWYICTLVKLSKIYTNVKGPNFSTIFYFHTWRSWGINSVLPESHTYSKSIGRARNKGQICNSQFTDLSFSKCCLIPPLHSLQEELQNSITLSQISVRHSQFLEEIKGQSYRFQLFYHSNFSLCLPETYDTAQYLIMLKLRTALI